MLYSGFSRGIVNVNGFNGTMLGQGQAPLYGSAQVPQLGYQMSGGFNLELVTHGFALPGNRMI